MSKEQLINLISDELKRLPEHKLQAIFDCLADEVCEIKCDCPF